MKAGNKSRPWSAPGLGGEGLGKHDPHESSCPPSNSHSMMLLGFSVSGNNKPTRFSCRPTLPVLRASGVVEGPRTILMARRSESKMVHREKPAGSQAAGSPRGLFLGRGLPQIEALGGLRLGKCPFKPCFPRWCSPVPDVLQALRFQQWEPF